MGQSRECAGPSTHNRDTILADLAWISNTKSRTDPGPLLSAGMRFLRLSQDREHLWIPLREVAWALTLLVLYLNAGPPSDKLPSHAAAA